MTRIIKFSCFVSSTGYKANRSGSSSVAATNLWNSYTGISGNMNSANTVMTVCRHLALLII